MSYPPPPDFLLHGRRAFPDTNLSSLPRLRETLLSQKVIPLHSWSVRIYFPVLSAICLLCSRQGEDGR